MAVMVTGQHFGQWSSCRLPVNSFANHAKHVDWWFWILCNNLAAKSRSLESQSALRQVNRLSLINFSYWSDCNKSLWVMGITGSKLKPKDTLYSCEAILNLLVLSSSSEFDQNGSYSRYSAPSRGANRHIDLTDRLYIGGIQVPWNW